MKKILVAIDGSEPALHAARVALDLASHTHGEVTLVHVVPQLALPAEVSFSAGPLVEESVKIGEFLLEEAAKALGQPQLRRCCVVGGAAERLSELADAEHADLVVVGSKGRGAVARLLVGSTTDRLIHISNTPVLVVR